MNTNAYQVHFQYENERYQVHSYKITRIIEIRPKHCTKISFKLIYFSSDVIMTSFIVTDWSVPESHHNYQFVKWYVFF